MAAIRNVTENLIESLTLNVWPRPAAIVDFGIDTQEHLKALKYALEHGGRTPEEFDVALGSGEALNRLCAVPGQPYIVLFETAWDHLFGPKEEEDNDSAST